MKKSKILVPALGILVLSTAASITGTVAWFTASSFVEVSGFKMQAEAEKGIVIANEAKAEWKITATASHGGSIGGTQQAFVPTSTANATAWFHANAADAESHEKDAESAYVSNTASEVMDGENHTGVYQMNIAPSGATANPKNIYLLNKFYIQSSSASAISGQDIYITNLMFSGNVDSEELNKSLRMAIKYGAADLVIFGFGPADDPDTTASEGFTVSYTVGTSATPVTAQTTYDSDADDNSAKIEIAQSVEIPAYNAAGTTATEVSVYLYFEGEDINCKSANIEETLDELEISFQLGNKVHD